MLTSSTGRDNYHTARQNYIKYDKNYNYNKINKNKERFTCLLRHLAWKWRGTILVEREGMEKQDKLAPYGTGGRLLLTATSKSGDTKTNTKIKNPAPISFRHCPLI